jgi:nickel superoxide dismutase
MSLLNIIFPLKKVYAHCDIPCGVYDPKPAQMAAESVFKMVDKILNPAAVDEKDQASRVNFHNNMTRYVIVKEQQAEICKREILILWTDFFKEENLKDFPELHSLVWKTTKLCSTNKREVSLEKAKELQDHVDKIAEIFGKVKSSAK